MVQDDERIPASLTYAVSLPAFEGPLDLLLHLCQKHEIDILEIPVGLVTEKYLEYLDLMQLLHLDVASEYLVMAATLVHIKSRSLLPSSPADVVVDDEFGIENEDDPREALIRRLLEYQKYKKAGEDLVRRGVEGSDVFARGTSLDEAAPSGTAPLREIPMFELVAAFQRVLERAKVEVSHDIVADRVSLADRIHELSDLLAQKTRMRFEELFDGVATRFDLVITFLALLEMTKLRMTRLEQLDPSSPIFVELTGVRANLDEVYSTASHPAESPEEFSEPLAPHHPTEEQS